MNRIAATVLAFAPFAFALMRSVETDGRDLRYLWLACAAFIGAMARMALAARSGGRRMTRGTLAVGVLFMSMLSAVFAAFMLDMAMSAPLFLVSGGFGICFAASTFLRMRSH
jgi:hypothetical protein